MDFIVKAVRDREMVALNISAIHADDALLQAQARGYSPISAIASTSVYKSNKTKGFSLSLFTQELNALLEAGINLVEAIETLAVKDEKHQKNATLEALVLSLQQGLTFSDALEQQPQVFPLLYIATVRASEKTGDLSQALSRYLAYEDKLNTLKKKIISASIYPILLMLVGSAVILFLLGFVVPKFSGIYEGTGGDLPFLSKLLLSWGGFIEQHSKAMLVCVAVIVGGVFTVFSQASFRKKVARLLWQIPTIGKRVHVYQLARFYRTLGMLLNGGTPIIIAMQSVEGLLDNALQANMKQATFAINQGQPISLALEQAGLTTPVAKRMLAVGERSGNIGHMMERVANFFDDDLARWMDWFTKLFEPLLMLFIGLVIGVVVLLLYMPIFELAGSIQ